MAAVTAAFGTGIPLVNLDQGTPIPGRFVLQLPDQLTPTRVRDRLRQPAIADQMLDSQRLHAHRLVFTDEAGGEFVQTVESLVSDLGMRTRDLTARLLAVLGAVLATGKALLRRFEPTAAMGEMFGI